MRYASIELKNSGLAEESIYVTLERNMKCAVAFWTLPVGPGVYLQGWPRVSIRSSRLLAIAKRSLKNGSRNKV